MSTSIPRGNLLKLYAVQVALDVASVATATSAEQTFTVNGVKSGDIVVSVNKPSATAGLGVVNARVSADDTVALTFMNTTAGALDPASETYTIVLARAEPMGSVFNA